jgi:hypothetical protein
MDHSPSFSATAALDIAGAWRATARQLTALVAVPEMFPTATLSAMLT